MDQEVERIDHECASNSSWSHYFMFVHLQAYAWAYQFVYRKTVLDAACGVCYGTSIYSTGAKNIIAVDKDQGAIARGKKLKHYCPVKYLVKDLNRDILPSADICISVETIEHLNGDGFFLKNLDVGNLVFTVPIDMASTYHKIVFKSAEGVVNHLRNNGWFTILYNLQDTYPVMEDLTKPNGVGLYRTTMMMGIAERSL